MKAIWTLLMLSLTLSASSAYSGCEDGPEMAYQAVNEFVIKGLSTAQQDLIINNCQVYVMDAPAKKDGGEIYPVVFNCGNGQLDPQVLKDKIFLVHLIEHEDAVCSVQGVKTIYQ